MKRLGLVVAMVLLGSLSQAADLQDRNKAVARRVFDEIFNRGRFEVAGEIYASDFVNHARNRDVALAEDQAWARVWREASADLKMTVTLMIAEDDLVAVLWRGVGTHTGSFQGLPPTGKKLEGRGITIWRIVNGRIVEEWSEFDQRGLMEALGAGQASPAR